MTTVTAHDITSGLHTLGLHAGDVALVHSSLSSFGHVEGGAEAVIDALLETVGPTGTILMPTLTGSEALSPDNPPVFDPRRSPCWVGRIPETFRQRPDAIRSLHATHSAAAIGREAVALTTEHLDSITPCDAHSPYGKLAQMPNGYILLLGVDHQRNTTMHHIEELVGVDYHIQPGFARAQVMLEGQTLVRHILLHRYGTARNFNVMEPALIERGIQQNGRIGQADVRLIHAGRMVEITAQALRLDPRLLCDPDG